MSRDVQNDFALAIQRLRVDRYTGRQHGDYLRTIDAAYHDALATIKQSSIVAVAAPAVGEGDARVLTCVYCGQEYGQGTAAWGDAVLTDHIKLCARHPMRQALADNARLRGALIGLVGEPGPDELRKMEAMIRVWRTPDEDKAVTINAIHALLPDVALAAEVNG